MFMICGRTIRTTDRHGRSHRLVWLHGHIQGNFEFLIGDVLYFDADNEINGRELMAYNLKTDTHWVVADIVTGMTSANPRREHVNPC